MIERRVTLPELGLIAGTRFALGIGAGLLLAGRLDDGQRRAAGWALLAFGALSTIPLAAEVLGHKEAGSASMRDMEEAPADMDQVREMAGI